MTENGWPPDTDAAPFVSIPLSACVQVTIPGTSEKLWFQKGAPAIILPAFLADLNAYIESSNNSAGYGDEGSWTNGNSVGTSNHLGATAFDFNWTDHPMGPAPEDPAAGWQGSDLIDGDQVPAVQALLDWYEGTVYWGGNWDSPKDSMHFQMGYGTYDPAQGQAGTLAVQDFIKRKIRADGFSTYRRGATDGGDDASNEQPPAFDRAKAITALYDAVPVIDEDRAAQLVDEVMAGLALAQCNNIKRIAMALAQWGHESDGFNTTEEYSKNGPYAPYIGRTWIQITWQSNYAAFGKWCHDRGLIDDPNYFVNNPAALADLKWAGIGAAWYWTVARPTINSLCDQGDIVGVTQLINGGQNGIDDRRARYQQAIALGDELLSLVTSPTTDEGDDIVPSGVDPDRLNAAIDKILGGGTMPSLWPSRSFLATDGNGVDDTVGMILNTDGNTWTLVLTMGYLAGEPLAVQQVEDVAAGSFPDGSFAASNTFVMDFAVRYCKALVEFKAKLNDLLASTPMPAAKKAPAKKTPPKKTSAKKPARR